MSKYFLSQKQLKIISEFQNNNITITGYTGTGKTTTAVSIALNNDNKKILYLSLYDYCIQKTNKIIMKNNLKNIECYTIKNFIEKIYQRKFSINDEWQIYLQDIKNDENIKLKYDYIIIDEAEDIGFLYYEMICKIIFLNKKEFNLCLVGDDNQSIDQLDFKSQYLGFANKLFDNNKKWKYFRLEKSFTISKNNLELAKNILADKNNILSNNKTNKKVNYLITNIWDSKILIKNIKNAINKFGINDVMLLTPSVENQNLPIKYIIINILPLSKIYLPKKDSDKINYEESTNKLIIANFKQSKNILKKVVFVINFDESFYQENSKKIILNNILYIATTRATKQLTLVQDFKNNMIKKDLKVITKLKIDSKCKKNYKKIIKNNDISTIQNQTIKINDKKDLAINIIKENFKNNKYFIDNLIFTIPKFMIDEIKENILIKKINHDKNWDLITDISDITVKNNKTLFYEKVNCISKNTILNHYSQSNNNENFNIIKKIKSIYKKEANFIKYMRPELNNYEDYINSFDDNSFLSTKSELKVFTLWNYYISGNKNKLDNVNHSNFDWLTTEILTKTNKILETQLSKSTIFKYEVSKFNNSEILQNQLTDYIDCIDFEKNTIWLFTCDNKINDLDFIKIAFQSYLINDNEKALIDITTKAIEMKLKASEINYDDFLKNINFKFKILNLKINTIYDLTLDNIKLRNIINRIFTFKYYSSDDENRIFIENNLQIKNLYEFKNKKIAN